MDYEYDNMYDDSYRDLFDREREREEQGTRYDQ